MSRRARRFRVAGGRTTIAPCRAGLGSLAFHPRAGGRIDRCGSRAGCCVKRLLPAAPCSPTAFRIARLGSDRPGRGRLRALPGLSLRAAAYRGWRLRRSTSCTAVPRGADATAPSAIIPERLDGAEAGLELPSLEVRGSASLSLPAGRGCNSTDGARSGVFPVSASSRGGQFACAASDAIVSRGAELEVSFELLRWLLAAATLRRCEGAASGPPSPSTPRPAQAPRHAASRSPGRPDGALASVRRATLPYIRGRSTAAHCHAPPSTPSPCCR